MTEFLFMVLTECYVDRQPELLSLLYDELDQERPRQLAMVFSPARSQPLSVKQEPASSTLNQETKQLKELLEELHDETELGCLEIKNIMSKRLP